MAKIHYKHEGCMDGEVFVGNIASGDKLDHLKEIKYRIGTVAYDIHGKKIASTLMRPLFIKKEDYEKYDAIMMIHLRNICERYRKLV